MNQSTTQDLWSVPPGSSLRSKRQLGAPPSEPQGSKEERLAVTNDVKKFNHNVKAPKVETFLMKKDVLEVRNSPADEPTPAFRRRSEDMNADLVQDNLFRASKTP